MNGFQTIEQLYFASLRYYSRKFDEITFYNQLVYVIDSFELISKRIMDFW